MTSYRKILVVVMSSLIMMATSCQKDDSTSPSAPIDGDMEYVSVPFSITVGIAQLDGSIGGGEVKQTFTAGDVIIISNPDVLYEPLAISTDGSEGRASVSVDTELKVRKGAELVTGITKLSAVLKNGSNYNNGKRFVDVKKIPSLAEGLEKYGCWVCDGFTYRAEGCAVTLAQSTVFLNLNLFRTTVSMKYGVADYSEIVDGECLYALPSGTVVECKCINFQQRLEAKEKLLYRVECLAPEQCLPALFSIGEGKYVFFSKGNLQYRPMDGSWRIAPQQYHSCFGSTGYTVVGDDYSEWMGDDKWTDVFRWGAIMEGGNPSLTIRYGDYDALVDDDGKLKGVCAYGAEWTLLDKEEWIYLLEQRFGALEKRGGAFVGGIEGWVILPDDWSAPEDVAPYVGQYEVKYLKDLPNNYTFEEWAKMESAGAVFLPETGSIYGNNMSSFAFKSCVYQSLSYNAIKGDVLKQVGGIVVDLGTLILRSSWSVDAYSNLYYPVRLVQKIDDSFVKTK
ncbi:MAG: hypothetical protein IJ894_12470 [Bacteroidales bacterium]|nr:hypothetical protein [Bacteroidales bacterium]MBR2201532.1 hypothetical protein [Bacteroidales bacterium]MBR4273857.1 hypothetical protein [Bacteroidales bacterium]